SARPPADGILSRRFGFVSAGVRHRQLSHVSLHRIRPILRPGLPRGHEAGIDHLPTFAARAGSLCAVPHRAGGGLVCSIQVVAHVATDQGRQEIPWVRLIDAQGAVTEFRTAKFTNDISRSTIRSMDCMDCHNRPSHRHENPNNAVNLAMALRKMDSALPWIKT